MRLFLLVLLLVAMTEAKKKGDYKAVVGYKECGSFKESYKNEGKEDKAMRWIRPKAMSDICGVERECPVLEELENRNCGFGIREIAAGKWVSTKVLQTDGESKYDKAFLRLFNYIRGSGNQDGAAIPMTSPVIVRTFLNEDMEEEKATMHFYLPSTFQDSPPNPTSEMVSISDWEDVVVYYRAFGFKGEDVPQEIWDREFRQLGEAIYEAGLQFSWMRPITATFTQPGVAEQRHEALFLARGHYTYSYDSSLYSWEESRGYKECARFPDTVKPKAVDAICGKDAECPVVEDMDNENCGFGVRDIKAGKWVSTDILESDGAFKYSSAFFRLFEYIRGENEDIRAIDMTIPVITKTYLDENFEGDMSTMHFYLPPQYHENPPAPTDELVRIESWIDTVTYYRTAGGYTNYDALWEREFRDLGELLVEAGKSFDPYIAVTATFTRPGYGDQRHEAIFLGREDD